MKKTILTLVVASMLVVAVYFAFFASSKRPNIILITIDTTRADALGIYGNEKINTPFLDAIARSGCRFSQCYSQASITLPSHSSILTGLIPPFHGVHNNSTYRLREEITTLPELMKQAGYDTGAFIGSVILLKQYGLSQGFDVYDDDIVHYSQKTDRRTIVTRRAEETLDRAWNWIQRRSKPFFSWIHLYDPHWPYEAPSPYFEAYADQPYYGELAYVDVQIGRLLKRLQEKHLLRDTILVITADHGESLGDHGERTHGFFCYDSTTHVPLIVSTPLGEEPGHCYDHMVATTDIAPFIARLAGAPSLPGPVGPGLLDTSPRTVYSEAMIPFETFYCSPIQSLKTDTHRFYRSSDRELFQVQDDPGEKENRAEDAQEIMADLESVLADIDQEAADNVEPVQLDLEMVQMLKSLGYIHDGGTFHDQSDPFLLPSPVASVEPYRMLQQIRGVELEFPFKAIEKLEEVSTEYPDHIMIWKALGELKTKGNMEAGALEALRKATHLRPEDPRLHNLLGQALFHFGHVQESLVEFTAATQLDPTQVIASYNLARVRLELDDVEGARQAFLQTLELNPDDLFTLNNLAFIALNHDQDPAAAQRWIEQAKAINSDHPMIKANFATIMRAVNSER